MKPVHCGGCDNFDGQNKAVTHYISYTKNKLHRRILEDMRVSSLVKKNSAFTEREGTVHSHSYAQTEGCRERNILRY